MLNFYIKVFFRDLYTQNVFDLVDTLVIVRFWPKVFFSPSSIPISDIVVKVIALELFYTLNIKVLC